MDCKDAPDPTATATPNAPLSLKSVAQQLLVDTLEPHERVDVASECLREISHSDLTGIPLAVFQQGVAAHAAIPINQALLAYLPQLKGRITAIDHVHQSAERDLFGDGLSYTTVTTTYAVEIGQGVTKTLVVDTDHGIASCHHDGMIWYKAKIQYGDVNATFKMTASTVTRRSAGHLYTSNLTQLFSTLADDLRLPVTSSPVTESWELERSQAQDETRDRLHQEAQAAKAAHKSPSKRCTNYCHECQWANDDLRDGLDLLDPPSFEYTDPELQTLDAKQRAVTFGRLVRGLFPRDFRAGEEYPSESSLDFTEAGESDVEGLLRGAAVEGEDLTGSGWA